MRYELRFSIFITWNTSNNGPHRGWGSFRHFTTEVQVRFQVVVEKVALGQVFLTVFHYSPVSNIPPTLHNSIYLHVALTRKKQENETWDTSKRRAFGCRKALKIKYFRAHFFSWSTKSLHFPVLHTASTQFHHLPLLPKDLPCLQPTFTRTGAYWEHAKQYILSPSCNKYSASRDILLLLLLILRLLQYSFYLAVRKAANCAPEAVLWPAISIRYFLVVILSSSKC